MPFTLASDDLERLCKQNGFAVPANEMIFFGFRGCLPVNTTDHVFAQTRLLRVADVDYTHPRCTLVQWKRVAKTFAVYPGSTSPHKNYTRQGSNTANQLMTGLYQYKKGQHRPNGTPTSHLRWHDAFRKDSDDPVLRSSDDIDYDGFDDIELDTPRDNIHAGWCQSVDQDKHASAGCQVVVGFPKCAARGNQPNLGPWKSFLENGYNSGQTEWTYVLLNGRDAATAAALPNDPLPLRLRYGSVHAMVGTVQQALKQLNLYSGNITNTVDFSTLRAIRNFQQTRIDRATADGIVGAITAEALGISPWPTV